LYHRRGRVINTTKERLVKNHIAGRNKEQKTAKLKEWISARGTEDPRSGQ
jgi:hypothetical protein